MKNLIKLSFLPISSALLAFLFIVNSSVVAETRPTLTLSYQKQDVTDLSVNERTSGILSMTATLSEAHSEKVSFSFGLITGILGGTAELRTDFSFPLLITGDESGQATGATIEIPAGETEITFRLVNIRDDIYDEDDETINFFFQSSDSKLDQTRIKITIVDDELTPTILLSAPGVVRNQDGSYNVALNENEPPIDLALTLLDENNQSSYDIVVTYLIDQQEGINDSNDLADYSGPGVDSKITLRAETSEQSFQLVINDDLTVENTEIITFTLVSASFTNEAKIESAAIIHDTRNTITVTVSDEDANAGAINDTGVTSCYNASKLPIDCGDSRTGFPGSDQDGDQFTPNRYVKLNESGDFLDPPDGEATCVYDENTNLVWQAKAENFGFSWLNTNERVNGGSDGFAGSSGTLGSNCGTFMPCNTDNYKDAMNTLRNDDHTDGLCNISNWRLPKLRELVSIINFEPDENINEPVLIDTEYFSANKGFYWTSTPSAVLSTTAWCVFFGEIKENHIQQCEKGSLASVRLVATCNQSADSSRPC